MKRLLLALALLLLLAACAAADSVTGCSLTVDSGAEYVDFGSVKIKKAETAMALLDQLPNLRKADMYESRLSNDEMDKLAERYPQVEFGWTVRVGDHYLRTDATAFSTLHTPKRDAEHKTRDFYALKFCTKLEALDIGHNAVTDISFLEYLPELKVLILACNKIRDISVLAKLQKLEYLELFTNKFTDITPLSGLTNLIDLNLSNNAITGLEPLYGLTNLRRFRLCMDRSITEEQKAAFKAALPECEMGWGAHPTAEGWREHPRYDVIFRIFHSGVYEPF